MFGGAGYQEERMFKTILAKKYSDGIGSYIDTRETFKNSFFVVVAISLI